MIVYRVVNPDGTSHYCEENMKVTHSVRPGDEIFHEDGLFCFHFLETEKIQKRLADAALKKGCVILTLEADIFDFPSFKENVNMSKQFGACFKRAKIIAAKRSWPFSSQKGTTG